MAFDQLHIVWLGVYKLLVDGAVAALKHHLSSPSVGPIITLLNARLAQLLPWPGRLPSRDVDYWSPDRGKVQAQEHAGVAQWAPLVFSGCTQGVQEGPGRSAAAVNGLRLLEMRLTELFIRWGTGAQTFGCY